VSKIKGWAAEPLLKLGKNGRKDRVETRLDFEGSLNESDLNITGAALRFIRNGFGTAERASFEPWHSFRRKRGATESIFHNNNPRRSITATTFGILRETISRWRDDESPRMAASLAYYTTFAMVPLLILAIAIAGLALGHDAAQGRIVEQIGGVVASKVQPRSKVRSKPRTTIARGGCSPVFSELLL
jgi:hypothetical protein